jgi:hypothetical protein
MRASIVILCFIFTKVISAYGQTTDSVTKPKIPAIQWNGGIGIGTQLYKVSGIPNRMVSPMWNIHGNASVSLYGKIHLPFSFTIGRQGNSANFPVFNQIGMSPAYKWVTVHAGWRQVHLSDLTLGDHTFMGGGIELKPGKLRFTAVAGRFRKARNFDPEQTITSVTAVFRRTGYGIKIGLGTEDNFFDLIYFKAKDDLNSLSVLPPDSLLTASENAVAGFSTRWKIGSFVNLFAEGAVSAFTRDIRSSVNDSTAGRLQELFLQPRFSTRANYALKTGIEFGSANARLRVQYDRIAPEYETMGSFFFLNDLENYTIAPNFSLFSHKLRLNGYAGIQKNNLLNNRSETTKRFIGMGNITFQPTPVFGVDFQFNSVNINQQQANIRFSDTIRVAMITTHYSLTPRWTWIRDTSRVTSLLFSANYQVLNERNPFTRDFTDMTTWFVNAHFNKSYPARGFSWHGGLNYNIIALSDLNTTRYGLSAGIDKQTKDQKWIINGNMTFNLSQIENKQDGNVTSLYSSIRYAPKPKHAFTLSGNILINRSAQFDDFTEYISALQYNYLFR